MLTLETAAAPPVARIRLLVGLVVVLGLTLPLLVWLSRVFARSDVGH